MQRTENNFYRVCLKHVYKYHPTYLEMLTDDDCQKHYELLQEDLKRRIH